MTDSHLQLLTPETTMQLVLETIKEVIPYELAVILSKEKNNKLKVRHFNGVLAENFPMDFEISLSKRPDIDEVINIGKVKLVEETDDEEHEDTYHGVIDLPIGHSCMLIPLKSENSTIGLLTLDHRQCDIFTPQKVNIAQTLSRLISLALAQSLYNEQLFINNQSLLYERTALFSEIRTITNNLIGNSNSWNKVIDKVRLCAPTDTPIMILGETGTGKEEIAKTIHALSDRKDKPFIALNCSALNSNLAESELFGHEKGAFTGAIASRKGRFELADGGTLFLDEIGDLPFEIQPKLLRALQNHTFERVGSEKTIKSDVRIVCATHVNLRQKIDEGQFREDLFYRLNVFPINLPPLRERKGDIVLLSNFFINKKYFGKKIKKIVLSKEALTILENNYWRGNVRELQNVLERAIILNEDGIIKPKDLIFETNNESKVIENNLTEEVSSLEEEISKIIKRALIKTDGKIYGKDGAAELLKVKPTTLQSKIKKLNIN